MATPGNAWMSDIGQYAPMTTGTPYSPQFGSAGVPFMSGGGMPGMAMQMFGMPYAQGVMQQQGMMPFGFQDQNVSDYMRNRAFQQAYTQTNQGMMQFEYDNAARAMAGFDRMMTGTYTEQQRQRNAPIAYAAAQAASALAPIAPGFVDQLGGYHGSASVMAMQMHMGGRYRLDPVTGRMGMSQASVQAMAGNIYQNRFGDNLNLNETQGFTAGQYGSLFNELSRRGMVMGSQGGLNADTLDVARRMASSGSLEAAALRTGVKLPTDLSKLSGSDLDKLRGDTAVSDNLKAVDVQRVNNSLRKYTDALSAMRDIFGDAGKPNAPMAELLQGLEKLTMGTAHQLDPQKMASMVRNMRSMAQMTGMPMDAMMAMQEHSALRLQQMGANPAQAMNVAFGGASWSAAYRAMGGSAVHSWGRLSADQMAQADVNLRTSAATSDRANRMNALMRLREMGGGSFKDAGLESMANAIMAGDNASLDVNALKGGNFEKMLLGSADASRLGLTAGSIRSMLIDRNANQEYGVRYGTENMVRGQQSKDFQGWMANRAITAIKTQIKQASGGAISDEEALRIARKGASGFSQGVMDLTDADMADPLKRNAAFGNLLQNAVAGTDAAQYFTGDMTAQGMHIGSSLDKASQMRYGTTLQNQHALFNTKRTAEAERIADQARYRSIRDSSLAPVGRGGMLARMVDFLETAKGSKADMAKGLAAAAGGLDVDDITGGMRSGLDRIVGIDKALADYNTQLQAKDLSKEQRKEIKDAMAAKKKELDAAVKEWYTDAEKAGIKIDPTTGKAVGKEGYSALDKAGASYADYLDKQLESTSLSPEARSTLMKQRDALRASKGGALSVQIDNFQSIFDDVSKLEGKERDAAIKATGMSEKEFNALGAKLGLSAKMKGDSAGGAGGGKMEITGKLTITGGNTANIQATTGAGA